MTPYTSGAIAMRELAATAADDQGQHGVAAAIRMLPLPTPTEPATGLRFVWGDEPGTVQWAHHDVVAMRLDCGAVRWPTREQWRDAVNSGAIQVIG